VKFAGIVCLIISTTSLGYHFSNDLKQKILVCRQLSVMCDLLLIDLGYTVTPIYQLLDKVLNDERLNKLNFISFDNVKKYKNVESCLAYSDNQELSNFLYSLGKSDVKSQINLITGFKEYINIREADYNTQYSKNSKLYLSFGFFGGVVISLVLI
jgi:stage III sporulation protein AB